MTFGVLKIPGMQVSVMFSKFEPTLTNCATPVTVLSILCVLTLSTHITVSTGALIALVFQRRK